MHSARRKVGPKERREAVLMQLFPQRLGKGEMRKAEIIDTAIEVIAKQGFEDFSFDQLAKKLKLLKSHIAYHYPSKEELFMKCVELITATAQKMIVEELSTISSPQRQLEAYIRSHFRWFDEYHSQTVVFLTFYSRAATHAKYAELNSMIRGRSIERVQTILEDCGVKDAYECACTVIDIITGSLIDLLTTHQRKSRQNLEAKCEQVLKHCRRLCQLD